MHRQGKLSICDTFSTMPQVSAFSGGLTTANERTIGGIATRGDLGACTSLFRLDDDDSLLLPLVLDVPDAEVT